MAVVRQLMSGKEAAVYVVRCGDETRCAKVYKEADSAASGRRWTTPRTARSRTRARRGRWPRARAFGRQAQEAAWQSAEVDALYRLAAAGVRVPRPHGFTTACCIMELVVDADGDAAPRLNDVSFTADEAARTTPRCCARWCACSAPASCMATCPNSTSCSPPTGPS
jgi:RIO kinase 1